MLVVSKLGFTDITYCTVRAEAHENVVGTFSSRFIFAFIQVPHTVNYGVQGANNESSEVIDILLPVIFYLNPSIRIDVKNLWRFFISVLRQQAAGQK